jgi:hypothetical protein
MWQVFRQPWQSPICRPNNIVQHRVTQQRDRTINIAIAIAIAHTANRIKPRNISILAFRAMTVLPGVKTSIWSVVVVVVVVVVVQSAHHINATLLVDDVATNERASKKQVCTISSSEYNGSSLVTHQNLGNTNACTVASCLLDNDTVAHNLEQKIVSMRSRFQLIDGRDYNHNNTTTQCHQCRHRHHKQARAQDKNRADGRRFTWKALTASHQQAAVD